MSLPKVLAIVELLQISPDSCYSEEFRSGQHELQNLSANHEVDRLPRLEITGIAIGI